jgi:thiamine pyrophosphate-dependent acetolactate synthase large subunit-like protein
LHFRVKIHPIAWALMPGAAWASLCRSRWWVAIAQPARRVFALKGAGSLLMQLGVLRTIASRRPKNVVVIVWVNGAWQIAGGQPTATAKTVELVGVARASGLPAANGAKNEAHFENDEALVADAPCLSPRG